MTASYLDPAAAVPVRLIKQLTIHRTLLNDDLTEKLFSITQLYTRNWLLHILQTKGTLIEFNPTRLHENSAHASVLIARMPHLTRC